MNPTNYDQVLTGLQTMNREMIVEGVRYLLHFNDPNTFQYKFRLDYSRWIRESTTPPIKTDGEFSLEEIATIATKNPEILDYTADHIPFGKMLLEEIKKAEANLNLLQKI